MNVSIVICTYNHCASLVQTLAAIERVRVPEGLRCELLIVDNASTDRTPVIGRSYTLPHMPIHYAHEPRQGQCFARNTGIAAARGEIILFTDDDVRPTTHWLEGMSAPILSGKVSAVAGGVTIAPHLLRPWMTPEHRAWFGSTEGLAPEAPEHMVGANMAVSREVLDRIPQFDSELGPGALGFYDDTLFSWQLTAAGYRIGSAFHAAVEHHFDEARLRRSSCLDAARKHGRCAAYVMYHWAHEKIRRPYRELGETLIHLAKSRVRRGRDKRGPEGISTKEMQLVAQAQFYKQYLIERKRPHNYEKKGLVKLYGPA